MDIKELREARIEKLLSDKTTLRVLLRTLHNLNKTKDVDHTTICKEIIRVDRLIQRIDKLLREKPGTLELIQRYATDVEVKLENPNFI